MVTSALVCAFYACAQVTHKLVLQPLVVGELGHLIVAHVHERIPLIMACAVGTHPWCERLPSTILYSL